MMSHQTGTQNRWTPSWIALAGAVVALVGLVALAGTAAAADIDPKVAGHYTWSAELVAFDESSQMVTVKARVVGSERDLVQVFEPGDRVLLAWSGITQAAGVRWVSHLPFSDDARLTMPVEFVAFDQESGLCHVPHPDPDGRRGSDSVPATRSLGDGDRAVQCDAVGYRGAGHPSVCGHRLTTGVWGGGGAAAPLADTQRWRSRHPVHLRR